MRNTFVKLQQYLLHVGLHFICHFIEHNTQHAIREISHRYMPNSNLSHENTTYSYLLTDFICNSSLIKAYIS